jgi:hypothetical protein
MAKWSELLTRAAERRALNVPLNAERIIMPPEDMPAHRPQDAANHLARDLASEIVARQVSPEVLRMTAGYLLDAAARRHGVHPDTLRAEGGL